MYPGIYLLYMGKYSLPTDFLKVQLLFCLAKSTPCIFQIYAIYEFDKSLIIEDNLDGPLKEDSLKILSTINNMMERKEIEQ